MHSHIKGLCYLSLNVRALNSPIKRKKVLSYLKSKRCDIGFLQEMHLLDNETKKLGRGWVGHVFVASGTSHSRGVAILINKHLQIKCIKETGDDSGRILVMLAEIQGLQFWSMCMLLT